MARLPRRLPQYPLGTSGVTDVAHWEDNEYFYFGTGDDAILYYDGTDFKIDPDAVGSGKLDVLGDISLPSDTGKIYFGASDDYHITFDGTNFLIDSGTHEMIIGLDTAGTGKLYLGGASVDIGEIYANIVDTLPMIRIRGGGYVTVDLKGGGSFKVKDAGTEFIRMAQSGTWFLTDAAADDAFKLSWASETTTDDIIGVEIDASTNLTMGTNKGATGLKIDVKAPNGSGHSRAVDVSSLAVDFPVLKVVADAITNPGTLSGQIAIDVGDTVYYIPYYTHGS